MNHFLSDRCKALQNRLRAMTLPLLMLMSGTALAAPGAHGPNGEHLDGPAQSATTGSNAPRFEARSETFELVATLRDDELSMLVNRFETNEPVLGAKVEVESGELKVAAKFHSDLGDYAVDDAAFLKAMKAPGEHALVITILAGSESDLLDGIFKITGAQADAHGHAHGEGRIYGLPVGAWIVVALAVLAGLGWAVFRGTGRQNAAAAGGAR